MTDRSPEIRSPMLVAQAVWASMHGLVAALIAQPQPHFPWEDVDTLVHVQIEVLLSGV